LSDGWYQLPAHVDEVLQRAHERGKIRIGSKLAIMGSKLFGPKEGYAPLEAPDSLTLGLAANSVRIAPWDARLGFHRRQLSVSVDTVDPKGGNTALVDVVIQRKLPISYMEAMPDGSNAVRTAEEEEKLQKVFEVSCPPPGFYLTDPFLLNILTA
ncbi:BRCA2, oligonucleotide/oligosaccharide-binding, domain 1-domain-containing protein, partial [Dimargaris cristalligena]